MVTKKVDILLNFLSRGMSDSIAKSERIKKSLRKLGGPGSITEAINRTKFTSLNTELKSMGSISKTTSIDYDMLNKKIERFAKQVGPDKQALLEQFAKKFNSFGSVMGMGSEEFKKFNDGTGRLNKGMMKQVGVMGRAGLRVKKLTQGFRGFKMELLGVMFFGMDIQKFFTGLLRPALAAVGVFKLWSTILTILFLPVALKILDWSIKFMDWLNKSESMQKFIRWITIIGIVLGSVLFFIGMFGLGIGSLIALFGTIISPIILAIGAFFTFIASMASSKIGIMALIAAFIGLAPIVSAGGDEVKKQGGIWSMLTGWIGNAVGIIITKLDEMWARFIDAGPVTRFLENIGLTQEAIEKLKNPIATLGDMFSNMWNNFLIKNPEIIKKMGEMGLKADEILQPWKNMGTIIPTVIDTLSEKMGTFISEKLELLREKLSEIIPQETQEAFKSFTESFGIFIDKIGTINLDALNIIIESLAKVIGLFASLRPDPNLFPEGGGGGGVPFTDIFKGGSKGRGGEESKTPSPTDIFNPVGAIVNVFINGIKTTEEEAERLGVTVEPT